MKQKQANDENCHGNRNVEQDWNLWHVQFQFSGDKPFNCEICQKKFALSCNLRAHLKTHEADYQNSAASIALYRRALAALGSQESAPNPEEDSPSFDEELGEEEEEELLDIEEEPNQVSGDDDDYENPRPSSISSNNNNNGSSSSKKHSLSDFAKQMTVVTA